MMLVIILFLYAANLGHVLAITEVASDFHTILILFHKIIYHKNCLLRQKSLF